MTPHRVQRKRTKGWRLPENTVCVSRPGHWGNPFKVGSTLGEAPHWVVKKAGCADLSDDTKITREMAVNLFRVWAEKILNVESLRGKNLACFCPFDQPCHADVLLEMANQVAGRGEEG